MNAKKFLVAAMLVACAAGPQSLQAQIPQSPGLTIPSGVQSTLWRFLGFQQLRRLRDAHINRKGILPGRERKPPLLRLADPANLESKNPAIKKAAEIKTEEDMAPQKIKAIKYLAKIGCGCYEGVKEALIAALEDCTEEVRFAAAKALREAAGCVCNRCGGSCCSEEVSEALYKRAYERDDNGCWLEPSERVRDMARQALRACCPGRGPATVPMMEGPKEGPMPKEGPDVPPPPKADENASSEPAQPLKDLVLSAPPQVPAPVALPVEQAVEEVPPAPEPKTAPAAQPVSAQPKNEYQEAVNLFTGIDVVPPKQDLPPLDVEHPDDPPPAPPEEVKQSPSRMARAARKREAILALQQPQQMVTQQVPPTVVREDDAPPAPPAGLARVERPQLVLPIQPPLELRPAATSTPKASELVTLEISSTPKPIDIPSLQNDLAETEPATPQVVNRPVNGKVVYVQENGVVQLAFPEGLPPVGTQVQVFHRFLLNESMVAQVKVFKHGERVAYALPLGKAKVAKGDRVHGHVQVEAEPATAPLVSPEAPELVNAAPLPAQTHRFLDSLFGRRPQQVVDNDAVVAKELVDANHSPSEPVHYHQAASAAAEVAIQDNPPQPFPVPAGQPRELPRDAQFVPVSTENLPRPDATPVSAAIWGIDE